MMQDFESEAAKEVAKKERERLKLQEKAKKEQLEKMREQLNQDAAAGEVRLHTSTHIFFTTFFLAA